MTLFEELKRRGLIAQMTNEEKIRELLDNEKGVPFYIGLVDGKPTQGVYADERTNG